MAKVYVESFKDFVRKYGTHTPRMIVGSAINQPDNETYRKMVTELMDDLEVASKWEEGE